MSDFILALRYSRTAQQFAVVWLLGVTLGSFLAAASASAGNYEEVYVFTGAPDGAIPYAGLSIDAQGRLYGTTERGGVMDNGAVFRLTRSATAGGLWSDEILHSFTGPEGSGPLAQVTLGADGTVYGTAFEGGLHNRGTVFSLGNASPWPMALLHSFGLNEGGYPESAVVFGSDGMLYGTTPWFEGGTLHYTISSNGTAYKISPSGDQIEYAVLHTLGRDGKGFAPTGLASVPPSYFDGFVSVGGYGGASGYGTVFALHPGRNGTATETTLYNFGPAPDVSGPSDPPLAGQDSLRNGFYGCASNGGAFAQGGIYKLSPNGKGGSTETVLYSFGAQPNDPMTNGYNAQCHLVQGSSAGKLYGTSDAGGVYGGGTFFELDPPSLSGQPWTEKVDVSFNYNAPGGGTPEGSPVRVGNSFYGTLVTPGDGAIYQLKP
jgi:uncharacterized repeat protein (TIGR03803 family)